MDERGVSKVRELREARGWSQRRLSVEANLTVGTISAIERVQRPSLETALKLAEIFGVPVEALFVTNGFTHEVQTGASAGSTEPREANVATGPSSAQESGTGETVEAEQAAGATK